MNIHGLTAIFRKEFISYFITPLAYVFIAIFLFASGTFTFYLGQFYEAEQASLDSFFTWHPWLYLFLIPAISMRLWAEERKSGTAEILFTLPIPLWQMVVGKFLAAWAFTAIALLATTPIWMTASYLGNPDHGVIFAGYIGSLLMAGGYLAIGSCISALTRNQVISFVISISVCFLFTLSGFPMVINFFKSWLPTLLVDAISNFSFLTNFDDISKGILAFNTVFFLFNIHHLMANTQYICPPDQTQLNGRNTLMTKNQPTKKQFNIGVITIALIAAFIMLNIIGTNLLSGARIDLTNNKLYTLSDGTKNILGNLEEPIHVRFFYSKESTSSIPAVRNYGNLVTTLLKQYSSIGSSQLTVEIIDPEPFSKEEDQAIGLGIQAIPFNESGETVYFGLALTSDTNDIKTIPFLDPERESFLEYDITNLIYELSNPEKPTLGVLSSIDFNANPYSFMGQSAPEEWTILKKLKEHYLIETVAMDSVSIPETIDLLMIIHPAGIEEKTEQAIDQYVLSGGKAVIFVDPYFEMEGATNTHSNLPNLFKSWNIEYDENQIILDNKHSLRAASNSDQSNLQSLYKLNWLGLNPSNFSTNDITTATLSKLHLISAGSINATSNTTLNVAPLITSSASTMLSDRQRVKSATDLIQNFESTNQKQNFAVLLSGKATTAFPKESKRNNFITESTEDIHVAIIADVDLLRDQFWLQKQRFFGQTLLMQIADNGSFVNNITDQMAGSSDLIGLRSRSQIDRPFTVVGQLRKNAETEFLAQEQQLKQKLKAAEETLIALQSKREDSDSTILTKEQEAEIQSFRDNIFNTRSQLRNVQHALHQEIIQLGAKLKFLNIILFPIIIILLSIWVPRQLGIKRS